MGDFLHSPTSDSYSALGLSQGATAKEINKAYKSLVKKWHPDKHPSNKSEAQVKFHAINEAYKVLNHKKRDEKKAKNIKNSSPDNEFQLNRSLDDNSILKKSSFLSRSLSRRSKTPNPSHERNAHRTKNPDPELDINASKKFSSPTRKATSGPLPRLSKKSSKKAEFDEITNWDISSPTTIWSSLDQKSTSPSLGALPRTFSRIGSNPIIYSQSMARKKPPPVEKNLECTLEELCLGSVKKIKITRDVINDFGMIAKEEEILRIKIKPGWKKGTKLTFEGKGDAKPGTLPADIIFLIDEIKHPLFERDGDDLEIVVEVPLAEALTDCLLQVPLLGENEKMRVHIDDIIFPGYEKVIKGQGMPKSKEEGARGDLRIKFLVEFPSELADEQRDEAVKILQGCSWD